MASLQFPFKMMTGCLALSCVWVSNVWAETTLESSPDSPPAFEFSIDAESLSLSHGTTSVEPTFPAWPSLGKYEASTHSQLGIFYYNHQNYDLAENEYKQSLQHKPDDAATHFNLGIVYFDRKQYDEAEKEYKDALRLDPKFHMAYNNLGTLFLMKKEYQEAELAFKSALESDPEDLKALVNLGNIYFYVLKDLIQAQEEYQKALDIDPKLARVRNNLKTISEHFEESRKAEQRFEESIAKNPKKPFPEVEVFTKQKKPANSEEPDLFSF